jgi:hypothetical protein
MSDHSKEPWEYTDDRYDILDAGGEAACWTVFTVVSESDATRIVACVNALAGMRPEAVKGLVEAVERFVHECAGNLADPNHDRQDYLSLEQALAELKE